MKKHHEIDFMDGKIVHSVNRCIIYNNKHIEVARFKQPGGKLNLYEFNKKIRTSIKSEQGKSSRENLMATVLNLIAKIKWRTLKVDFAMLDPKNSFKTAKLSKISFDKETGKNKPVPLKMYLDYVDFIGSIISNNSKAFSYLSFRFFEKGKAVSLRFNVECESGFDKMNNFWKRYFFSGTVSTKKKNVEIKSYFQVHNTIEHFKNDLRKCIEEAVKE